MTGWRAGKYCLISDGQSLPVWPSPGHPQSWPLLMLEDHPDAAWGVPAVGGYAWTQLVLDVEERIDPYLRLAPEVYYLMMGGTTQVELGVSAANIYASEGAIAARVRAACAAIGVPCFVVGSTTTPSIGFDAAEESVRLDLNANYKIPDPNGYYDLMVQVAEDSRLDDPTDTTYYENAPDGTHHKLAGRIATAELMGAGVDLLKAA